MNKTADRTLFVLTYWCLNYSTLYTRIMAVHCIHVSWQYHNIRTYIFPFQKYFCMWFILYTASAYCGVWRRCGAAIVCQMCRIDLQTKSLDRLSDVHEIRSMTP